MSKHGCCVVECFRIAAVIGITCVTWKTAQYWYKGGGQKNGHAVDDAIGEAAKKLEMAAVALEEWAAGGLGETIGHGLDEILNDTKQTLEKSVSIVDAAMKRVKLEL